MPSLPISLPEGFLPLISPIEGSISLCNNGKIVIETEKNVFLVTKDLGIEGTAELFVLDGIEIVEFYHLTVDAIEKIVV